MMKSHVNGLLGSRSTSNSQQANKMKKSITSAFSTKIKSQITSSPNSMIYSIKQSRLNTNSKSNKKSNSQSSQSNKSFKALVDVTSALNNDSSKKQNLRKIQPMSSQTEKKGVAAIPVKNIKQKIVGKGINDSIIQHPLKVNNKNISQKQNSCDYIKKNILMVDKKLFNQKNQHLERRKNTEQSLLNFSCILTPIKEDDINLNMFEVGRKLGKGRFGDVYMAREIKTGFALAIKIINKKQLKESQMQTQLIQQIKIQIFSNHPNILKMYGFFDDNYKIYLLLELATNGCLFKQIRNKNYFQQNLASFYFRQIVSGTRYLHCNFVIHRDIKPENILNCFNVLKICDFGWAIYSPIYQRQTFCGTLDYVPPQIVTGQFYDQKADVWCLGVLCYQLCTGRAPFQSKSDQNQTYDKILKVQIDFPIYLSSQIVDFIGKILNRQPSKRMNLQQVQSHEWMRKYENQTGRMISKQIWDSWTKLSRNE